MFNYLDMDEVSIVESIINKWPELLSYSRELGLLNFGQIRLDTLIHQKGLTSSRERARALIMSGEVRVNGQRVDKPGTNVNVDVQIEITIPLPVM